MALAAGAVLLCMDLSRMGKGSGSVIKRNPQGSGSRVEELDIRVEEGEKSQVEVEVAERQYTKDEIQELFKNTIKNMDKWILGENKSFDRIETDMELITKAPDKPIQIEWESDRYDIMDMRGKIIADAVKKEGSPVNLKAVLTYSERPKEQAMYQCMVMIYPPSLSGKEKEIEDVKTAIQEQEEKTRTSGSLKLPGKVGGKKISYYQQFDMRGVVLIGMGIVVILLLSALEKQDKRNEEKIKKRQMMLDYPEIINKLALLLGAGMTVKNAWRKLESDYEEQKEAWGKRYAYEEMKITTREMRSGITEAECYERFGRRCGLQAYLKLGVLLSQNLRKGSKGLTDLLRVEAVQAFEERKAMARRLGEEAGTKLLMPMFLMLSIVLVIVIVPAFLSIQM